MYKRVLLKLSGESLGGPAGKGIDEKSLSRYAGEIVGAVKAGHQVAVVNGGGNIFRGLQGLGKGFDRTSGDRMGMLATVINSLGLACAIRSLGVEAEVFTATPMLPIARYYRREDAVEVLERGGVVLISGGTGNPFFTTDSGAALRALEIGADALLKGTRVDGVYTGSGEGPFSRQIQRAYFHQGAFRPSESYGCDGLRPLRTGPDPDSGVRYRKRRQSRPPS